MPPSVDEHEVYLVIYDLSHGMARSLSSQFLGPNHTIDIIPHSGVVVYNREYFFGGGIQTASPSQFRASRGIQPVITMNMGKTRVAQQQFEHWCRTTAALEYSPTSYDLLHRNCNNFADFALRDGLHLNSGVPDWVLDVPQTFLSSPLGSFVRPILQNMQMNAPVNGGSLIGPDPAPHRTTASGSSNRSTSASAANPWATTITTASASTAEKNSANGTTIENIPRRKKANGTPVLDSYNKPLLSTNDAAVPLCINKLLKAVDELPFDEEQKKLLKPSLEQLKLELTSKPSPHPTPATVANSIYPFLRTGLSTSAEGKKNLPENLPSIISFTCMLFRLVVLHASLVQGDHDISSATASIALVAKQLVANGTPLNSTAARSMAWCVLSNAFAHPSLLGPMIVPDSSEGYPSLEQLVDVAIADTVPTEKPKEIRQAASAFLYNLTLYLTSKSGNCREDETFPDVMVTLLCGVLESVLDESDDTAKSGRLLVAAMVVKAYSSMALQLIVDLGFVELIQSVRDGEKSKVLASELCTLLS